MTASVKLPGAFKTIKSIVDRSIVDHSRQLNIRPIADHSRQLQGKAWGLQLKLVVSDPLIWKVNLYSGKYIWAARTSNFE